MEPEDRAEHLARQVADRATALALADSRRATELAVDRAVKDANIDRDLAEHSKHLEEINGSQREMAKSLTEVEKLLGKISDTIEETGQKTISRRTMAIAVVSAVGAYSSLFALVISNHT